MFSTILLSFMILQTLSDRCMVEYGIDVDKNSPTYGDCVKCKNPYCFNCYENAYNCTSCLGLYVLDNDIESKTYGNCVSCPNHCDSCYYAELGQCETCFAYSLLNDKKECDIAKESTLPNCRFLANYK